VTSHILVVDDEAAIRHFLQRALEQDGYEVTSAGTVEEASSALELNRPDLTLLDLKLPDGSGIELLRKIKSRVPRMPVLMMTAYGEVATAVEAMKAGANDYLIKPLHLEQVKVVVERALSEAALWLELEHHRREQRRRFEKDFVRGASEKIKEIYDTVEKLAENDSTSVLIQGESGTGKQVIAQLIHQMSPRARGPFLEINCAAMPKELLESELFGHERGAFTDARDTKQGLLEMAHNGTLFLDEVGEMDLGIQVKLLKVLEQMTFRRLGGTRDIHVSVRIISATNRDLEASVAQGTFREDLFYRLMVLPVKLPPLRDRGQDILLLARHFLAELSQLFHKNFRGFAKGTEQKLLSYSWPGNIRELRNVIERTVLLEDGSLLEPHQLKVAPSRPAGASEGPLEVLRSFLEEGWDGQGGIPFEEIVAEVEKALIVRASRMTGWNQSRTAELLNVSRDKLRYRMKVHDLRSQDLAA